MTTSLADDYDRRQLTNWLCVAHYSEQLVTDRAFGAAAPRVWNNLPTDVITASSVATFKPRLKPFLFTVTFVVTPALEAQVYGRLNTGVLILIIKITRMLAIIVSISNLKIARLVQF